MSKFAVILPAAGRSARFGDPAYKKPFIQMNDKAVWLHAAERFINRSDVIQTIVVLAEEDRDFFHMKFGANMAVLGIESVTGGQERADSVQAALQRVSDDAEFVAIHDAARPCLADAWVDKVFAAAKASGAAMLAIPVSGTLKRSADGKVVDETVDRHGLYEAQTPQVFRRELLIEAYAKRNGFAATDDAELVERLGHAVQLVMGSTLNLKITHRDDLQVAAAAMKALPRPRLTRGGGSPLDDMLR